MMGEERRMGKGQKDVFADDPLGDAVVERRDGIAPICRGETLNRMVVMAFSMHFSARGYVIMFSKAPKHVLDIIRESLMHPGIAARRLVELNRGFEARFRSPSFDRFRPYFASIELPLESSRRRLACSVRLLGP